MFSYYARKFDTRYPPASMMASSQVEVSSRPPFRNVLGDHSSRGDLWERDRSRHKNLKNLVDSCISAKPKDSDLHSGNVDCKTIKNEKISKSRDKWAKAREMVFQTETSPTQSDNSGENRKNRAVSSLVQKWRDFEAESRNSKVNKNNNNSPLCRSRSNASSIFSDNSTITEVMHMSNSDVSESVEEKPRIIMDAYLDSQSDIATIRGHPMQSGDSNVPTEYERNRVADIIKRLTSVNGEECNERDQNVSNVSLLKIRTTCDHSPQKKSAGKIASSQIRGRHALNEMLMQMERDRYREIRGVGDYKAVSNFGHRRIQKLLRVRFLREQGFDAKDGSKSKSTASEMKKHSQGSSIMHLREKFNTEHNVAESSPRREHRVRKSSASNPTKEVIDHATTNVKSLTITTQHKGKTHPQEIAQSGSRLHTNAVANIQEVDTCSTSNHLKKDINNDNFTPSHQNTSQLQKSDKEVGPGLGATWKKTSYEIKTFEFQELTDKAAAASLKRLKGRDAEQSIASLHDWIKEISPSPNDLLDHQASESRLTESGPEWKSEFSQNQSEWEDEEALNYEQNETYQDWIYDVARPRSDWEDLRQERYQEMLDPFLKNGDIKQLLERRSVSTFLTSEMRDKIDQIMMSRTQANQKLIVNRVENKLEDEKKEYEQRMTSKKIEEEENKSPVGHSEAAECFEHTPSSICSVSPYGQYRSWTRNAIHSPTDESVSSPSLEQSPSSNSCTRDNKSSLEMELIYGLKGHVEQIHQEISDLRKALSTCISMQQVKPQNSVQPGSSDSHIHSVALEKGNESFSKTPRKGSCCLCFESEVDSLLYRCGHMCTCFKCAQELQWDSGKCPICRVSIQDVVRTRPG